MPEEDSYIDDVHMWLEQNDDEVRANSLDPSACKGAAAVAVGCNAPCLRVALTVVLPPAAQDEEVALRSAAASDPSGYAAPVRFCAHCLY